MPNKEILLPFEFVFHLMIFIAKSQTLSGTLAVHIATQGMTGNKCDLHRLLPAVDLLQKSVLCGTGILKSVTSIPKSMTYRESF